MYRTRVSQQRFGLGLGAALDSIAAFLLHTLGQHSDVSHKRNACLCDRFDLRDMTRAAFELYRLGAGVDKSPRRSQRLLARVVSVNRHIGDEQRLFHAASRCARMMQHFFQRYGRRVFVTKHHHAQRVPHKDDVDSAFIK